ncbi:hypothetical protein E4U55_004477 [Claviceps digitariae]|nr:hypothetical protein E4U55_004477 [Claviceps digitariae]
MLGSDDGYHGQFSVGAGVGAGVLGKKEEWSELKDGLLESCLCFFLLLPGLRIGQPDVEGEGGRRGEGANRNISTRPGWPSNAVPEANDTADLHRRLFGLDAAWARAIDKRGGRPMIPIISMNSMIPVILIDDP